MESLIFLIFMAQNQRPAFPSKHCRKIDMESVEIMAHRLQVSNLRMLIVKYIFHLGGKKKDRLRANTSFRKGGMRE